MLVKHLSFIALMSLTIGCASNEGLEQQVSSLSNKVDKLTLEVSKIKAQQQKNTDALTILEQAQEQTNQRIDNVAASYKK
ncbi:LPP leucine zipper domain-containing protein [Thalassotalea sp. G2M2-11]|uniref:LPP leucine zipper domain-containing protein n=1 Tax=Thalassotalea sp. G2M2-11 TaxID=2787627 RepID=UPI0019D16640|nr:LPP leucine zipper domain-containing protein [Thalassotalea sp. G2M2-11]